jgi:hypothetical protein
MSGQWPIVPPPLTHEDVGTRLGVVNDLIARQGDVVRLGPACRVDQGDVMRTSVKALITIPLAAGLAVAAAAPATAAPGANCHGQVISTLAAGKAGSKVTPAQLAKLASQETGSKVTAGDINKLVKQVCAPLAK